jgi:hypothetical protein
VIAYDELSEQQRTGLTREHWESLSEEQQRLMVSPVCIKGDGRPRVSGGIYCDHHTALLQAGYRARTRLAP